MRRCPIFGYYHRNSLKGLSKITATTDIEINKIDFRVRVFLEAPVCSPVNKFPVFYGIGSFVTFLTKACHLSLLANKIIRSVSIRPSSRSNITYVTWYLLFYYEKLVTPHRSPNWSITPLFSVRECWLDIFAVALHIRNK